MSVIVNFPLNAFGRPWIMANPTSQTKQATRGRWAVIGGMDKSTGSFSVVNVVESSVSACLRTCVHSRIDSTVVADSKIPSMDCLHSGKCADQELFFCFYLLDTYYLVLLHHSKYVSRVTIMAMRWSLVQSFACSPQRQVSDAFVPTKPGNLDTFAVNRSCE